MNKYGIKAKIEDLVGKTFTRVTANSDDAMVFESDQGYFTFFNAQDYCASVYIESIVGDLSDLVGTPILMAQEVDSDNPPPLKSGKFLTESYTWTFYKFATIKGYVDIRWYGTSNGYYSESVDIYFKA